MAKCEGLNGEPYHIVEDEPELVCPEYDMIEGPGNFQCTLTEPEDRTWRRDGQPAIKRLNEQHARIVTLESEVRRLEGICDQLAADLLSSDANADYLRQKLETRGR